MDEMDNLIDFGKRLHAKRVAEDERETAQAIASAKAAVKAERERPPPPHPWVLMLELVHALRPELTQAEAQETLWEFLRNRDPSGRSSEACWFYLDYGFEIPKPEPGECA